MLNQLSNSVLLEAYKKACQNNLEKDFISILEKELLKRKITPIKNKNY
ncbi:sporulation histidine kinase inhibitor Sda [Bacillus sp. JCM 19041]